MRARWIAKGRPARNIALLVMAAAAAAIAGGNGAEAASRDSARVALLDQCVMDEYRRQRSSDGVVKRCQCASQKALGQLSETELKNAAVGSTLSRTARRELAVALQVCR